MTDNSNQTSRERFFTGKLNGLMCETVEEEKQQMIKAYNIQNFNEKADDSCSALYGTRRPLVLFRGKPITREQTIQLITREEPLFFEVDENKQNTYFDARKERGTLENIFYRPGYNMLNTWIYSDGTIGGNLNSLEKYPELNEILPLYMHLSKYDFLDMIISCTLCNDSSCNECRLENYELDTLGLTENFFKSENLYCKDCLKYKDQIIQYKNKEWGSNLSFKELYFRSWFTSHVRSNVHEKVELTIWIHNGKADVLFNKAAQEKFQEYNNLYSAPEYEFMFSLDLYDYESTCICTKEFVEDCFEFIGRPRETCDEYIQKKFISPFNPDATVVTKEWVTAQYNKYIKPIDSHNKD